MSCGSPTIIVITSEKVLTEEVDVVEITGDVTEAVAPPEFVVVIV